MAGEEPLGGQTEGQHVTLAVEAVAEAREDLPVLLEVEAEDEAGRRLAHALERPIHPRSEEVHAAVGHARGEESCQLDVGWIAVAEGELDRVLLHPQSPVELAAEPVERLLEPIRDWHPCASGPAF